MRAFSSLPLDRHLLDLCNHTSPDPHPLAVNYVNFVDFFCLYDLAQVHIVSRAMQRKNRFIIFIPLFRGFIWVLFQGVCGLVRPFSLLRHGRLICIYSTVFVSFWCLSLPCVCNISSTFSRCSKNSTSLLSIWVEESIFGPIVPYPIPIEVQSPRSQWSLLQTTTDW